MENSRCSTEVSAHQTVAASQKQFVFTALKPEQLWPLLKAERQSVQKPQQASRSHPGVEKPENRPALKKQRSQSRANSSSLIENRLSSPSEAANPQRRDGGSGRRFGQRIPVGPASMLQVQGERTLPFETDLKLEDEYKTRYELSFRRSLAKSPQQEFSLSFGFAHRDEIKTASPPPGAGLGGARPTLSAVPPQRSATSQRLVTPPGAATPPSPADSAPRSLQPQRPSSVPPSASRAGTLPLPPPGSPSAEKEERTTVLQLGQDYTRRDRTGEWKLASRFNFGTGLLDATATTDDSADGQFFSWKGEVRRAQTVSPNHQLTMKLSAQLASDSLMGSEQFKIGNGPKIEGLKIRDDRGDNGIRLALENRLTLARHESGLSQFDLIPLVDVGYVWNRAGGNQPPDKAKEAVSVFGGLGFSWSPQRDTKVGVTLRVPLFYANDLDQTAADKESTVRFSYQTRW